MLHIRPATVDDVSLLHGMIHELAHYEHESENVTITQEELRRDGFGESPRFRALIAEWDGQVAAYALIFDHYSTWSGPVLFLEDLFVRESFRGRGIGKALLAEVARIAVSERYCGVRWEVLDWNQKAIDLYRSLGADLRQRWWPVLLTGDELKKLAERSR
jgi:GNAT superfamily N-acetyltransferase